MTGEFYRFCGRSDAAYHDLRRRIDACAAIGHSCEFPQCRMPEGCVPQQAVLGFFRQATGYLLYFRPQVRYQGTDPRLAEFFSHGERMLFPTFESFCEYLGRLPTAPAPVQPASKGSLMLTQLEEALSQVIVGQTAAVQAAAFRLWAHLSKKKPARPLSLIFHGPTGVGKSQLAKGIVPVLNQLAGEERYQFVWTEMNTFTEPHSAYRLTGAPPGYAGYDDPPVFEAVRHNPRTVFMFDELEKAHPQVLKVFMSLLDEGRCASRKEGEDGLRELDFRQCVFLFTTNADLTRKDGRRLGFGPPQEADKQETDKKELEDQEDQTVSCSQLARRLYLSDETARQAMVRGGALREIAGRFGGFIPFYPLSEAAWAEVTARQIVALGREHGLRVEEVEPELVQALTPEDALSARSSVAVLEGVLTAAFCQYAACGGSDRVRVGGTAEQVVLLPA